MGKGSTFKQGAGARAISVAHDTGWGGAFDLGTTRCAVGPSRACKHALPGSGGSTGGVQTGAHRPPELARYHFVFVCFYGVSAWLVVWTAMSDTPEILPDDPTALQAMILALQAENARMDADITKMAATLRA